MAVVVVASAAAVAVAAAAAAAAAVALVVVQRTSFNILSMRALRSNFDMVTWFSEIAVLFSESIITTEAQSTTTRVKSRQSNVLVRRLQKA